MDDGGTLHQERKGLREEKDQVWEEDAEVKLGRAEFGVERQGGKPSRSGAKRRSVWRSGSPWLRDGRSSPGLCAK